jgi:thioredoxin-like negative regulator of GroEL
MSDPLTWSFHGFCERLSAIKRLKERNRATPRNYLPELQAKVSIELQKQQAEDARTAAELQARMAMNSQDNQTAMALAQAEVQSGERFAVSTGTGINPQP